MSEICCTISKPLLWDRNKSSIKISGRCLATSATAFAALQEIISYSAAKAVLNENSSSSDSRTSNILRKSRNLFSTEFYIQNTTGATQNAIKKIRGKTRIFEEITGTTVKERVVNLLRTGKN